MGEPREDRAFMDGLLRGERSEVRHFTSPAPNTPPALFSRCKVNPPAIDKYTQSYRITQNQGGK